MSNILDLAERGIGSGARAENENLNLQYTATQLYNYSSIPNFKETIYEELEADWLSSKTGKNEFVTFTYMQELRNLLHNKRESSINMSAAFRVCVIVTIRQTLTQLTTQIHSRALADRDLDNKRKKSESIIVNAALNIIDQQIKKKEKSSLFEEIYEEFLTELLRSVTNTRHKVQHHYKNQIESIFTQEGFFQMSERSLRKWQIIMRQYLQNNTDLWTDLLEAFDSKHGIFASQETRMQSQASVFRCLSFLIFSTKKDQINE